VSQLFAFNNAEDLIVSNVPAGHYDAELQTWVAENASYASEIAPEEEFAATKEVTGEATYGPTGGDVKVDGKIDW